MSRASGGGAAARFLLRRPEGFGPGLTVVTRAGEAAEDTGMEFAVLRLRAGEAWESTPDLETAIVLLGGEVEFAWDLGRARASRASLLDEAPSVVHHAPGSRAAVTARQDSDLIVVRTPGMGTFPAAFFDPAHMVDCEDRDRGKWGGASWRIVRTVFDTRNRPEAALVLGEVVNLPGRWSSYPPHHHPQPEIYHYRFPVEPGYGHAELGEDVLKVRQFDTVKILENRDHSQVTAPGYPMFYVWVIRHLPGNKYVTPEFTAEHGWLREPGCEVWRPGTTEARR